MSTVPDGNSPVEKALTGGALERIGWYRFYFADERWEWSAEVEHDDEDSLPSRVAFDQLLLTVHKRIGAGARTD